MDLKWVISEEERTRHDALFYSQKPQNRYLSGEQARSLFIRSKLPLPDLSKIWKLADISRNNMLDISEFAVAMHLIQSRLKGVDIPEKLPETLAPFHVPWLDIPVMLAEERKAYEKAFLWKDKDKTGYVDAETACSTLIGSQLPEEVLAKIWNLSDDDRDGKLSMDEFCVALHLTRFCKKGNSLDGSVNVRSIVSQQWIEENFDGKKHRLTVVQTEKRRLLSLKEKLCHEIAGDLEEVAIAETIKTELNQVERDLYVLEKEENELRRTLQQIKDKSKRESFKPFDRSFLLKRQPSGADIFRGARKKNFASIVSEEDREIEKLWRVDDALTDFGATIKDTPLIPVNYNIRQDHFATVIELNQGQGSSESSGTTSPVPNGIGEDELEKESIHDLHPNSSDNEVSGKQEDSAEHTTTIDEVRERDRDVEILVDLSEHTTTHEVRERDRDVGILVDLAEHTTTHEVRESDRDVGILVDLAEHTTTTHEVRESERDVEFQDGEQTRVSSSEDTNNHSLLNGSSTPLDPQTATEHQSPSPPEPTNMDSNFTSSSFKKQIHENNRTDDEKSGSRGQCDDLAKNGIGEEEDANAKGSSNHIRIPVTESVDVATAPTAQFVAASRIDDLFGQLGEDGGSVNTKTRTNLDANRSPETEYEGAASPRSVSQEELIHNILEEKKKKDEERAKQRQADDEMLQKARQEHLRRDKEVQREAEQRKVTFQEEKRRLEQQVTLVQEGHETSKKAPLSRTQAGKFIEQELEEQRIREEITRMELEKIKEKEKIEMEKKKSKHVKKDEHPLVYRNKDVVQKPIFEEANDTETLEPQVSGLAAKRGSIIDLNEGVGTMNKVVTKPVESRQEHVYTQPVIRRTHENAKPLAGRKAENRKSFVELEIERQKEREEEARREAENARRIQAQRSSAGNVISKSAVELDRERQKEREKAEAKEMEVRRGREISGTLDLGGRKAVLKKQLEVETVVRQENTTTVESSPSLDEIDANEKKGDDISQLKKVKEEQQEELRRKEKEYLKQMQEEERKRREAEKEELDKLRKEVEMREAQELMRLKLVREEERNKKREAELKEAAKRKKEEQEKKEEIEHGTVFRKTAFAAHKLILEQRVLKALEETKQEATVPKRRSSSFERQTEYFTQTESLPSQQQQQQQQQQPEAGEDVPVKLRRAAFEKSGTTTESREELRKKRYSLNLDHASRAMNAREDVVLRNKHPGQPVGKKDRASFYADDIVAKESQAQLEREEELLRRVGAKPQPSDGKMTKAKSLGDVSFKKEQIGDQTPYQIVRKISLNEDETDSGFTSKDGLPVFADSRIQRELEEQRRREEVLRKEATEREKRYRLEGEKKKASEASSSSGTKDVSLNEIKRNPLPNKIQVKKPQASNRDSLTQSMAAHWETVLHTQDGGDTKKASNVEKKERKTSFIELEKEVERRREEELQKEREQGLLEKRRNEEEKKLTKQRKIEEELEKKRKVKEEKEKRQQRTLAMKSIFEKMGDKK